MIGYALSFVRSIILARMLTKADYGMAAAFATSVSMLELAGRFGLGQLLIQSRRGNSASFMASLHAVQLLSGLVSSLLVLALCRPMAVLFHVPGATWAFALLAVIPILSASGHLDNSRVQRKLRFEPAALAELIPQTLVTLAAWPLTYWLRDYRSILVLVIGKAAISCAVTHVLAKRTYRLRWNRRWTSEVSVWAWPLLASSIVVFASGQANQIIIGSAYSVSRLAGYAIASGLVNIPWFILSSVGTSLVLPILARSVLNKELFEKKLLMLLGGHAVAGVLLLAGFAIFGENVIVLLYGHAYRGSGIYVTILGAGVAVRLLGIVTTLAALAWGDTTNELFSNIWTCVTLPISLLAVVFGLGPQGVAVSVSIGEFVGLIASFWRLRRIVKFSLRTMATTAAYFFCFAILLIVVSLAGIDRAGLVIQMASCAVVGLVAVAVGRMLFPLLENMAAVNNLLHEE